MKFGTLHQILNPVAPLQWPKIEILEIQDGGGRHLKNRFFGHKSSTDCPILAKFCTTKMQMCKIQNGGRPPFWKSLSCQFAVSQWKIVRFWWNLVHYIRYFTRLQSRYRKLKFLKFKMAAAAILKFAFLAITHRPIVRFQRNFVWGSRTAGRQGLWQKLQIFKI